MTPARTRSLAAVAVTAGLGLQVLVWVLVVPPFAGTDEWDHAFRASAVAHGQLVAPPSAATRGTGARVSAGSDVVAAATPVCLSRAYTRVSDCIPEQPAVDGLVQIPSGAGRYSPVYYLLVGWIGRWVGGTDGLLAERLLSGALCLALIGAAIRLLPTWPRPDTALRAVVVAASPVLLLSCAIVAPNGLEMAAGVAWWAGLLTVRRQALVGRSATATRRPAAGVWPTLVVAGCLLGVLRALGPLWLVLSLAAVAPGLPRGATSERRLLVRMASAVRGHRLALSAIGLATVLGIGWTLSQGSLVVGREPSAHASLIDGGWYATWTLPIKIMEMVSANPGRGITPPPLTLGGWLLAFGLLAFQTVRALASPDRRRLAALVGLVVLVPWLIETATYAQFGNAWQGRYVLPLAVGVPLWLASGHHGRVVAADRAKAVIDATATAVAVAVATVAVVSMSVNLNDRRGRESATGWWPSGTSWLWWCLGLSLLLMTAGLIAAAAVSSSTTTETPSRTIDPIHALDPAAAIRRGPDPLPDPLPAPLSSPSPAPPSSPSPAPSTGRSV